MAVQPPPLPPHGFSIHKRIEGGATLAHPLLDYFDKEFQYPQADRRGCNLRLSQRISHFK